VWHEPRVPRIIFDPRLANSEAAAQTLKKRDVAECWASMVSHWLTANTHGEKRAANGASQGVEVASACATFCSVRRAGKTDRQREIPAIFASSFWSAAPGTCLANESTRQRCNPRVHVSDHAVIPVEFLGDGPDWAALDDAAGVAGEQGQSRTAKCWRVEI
jgi:hypothetical protein